MVISASFLLYLAMFNLALFLLVSLDLLNVVEFDIVEGQQALNSLIVVEGVGSEIYEDLAFLWLGLFII